MREIEKLLPLLQSVPVLHVDKAAAQARGDRAALDYARAVENWQRRAAIALAQPPEAPAERPSAFARILARAEFGSVANANVPA